MTMGNQSEQHIVEAFNLAKAFYGQLNIDVEASMETLNNIPISMHCWQGDDVSGFEKVNKELSGGIQVTGNYVGRADNPTELRQDLDKALSLLPGTLRLNLHAIYGEGLTDDRDTIEPKHFKNWVQWAKQRGMGLDFNPTCFSHRLSEQGFTLSHWDEGIRDFWIEHCKSARRIGAYFGKELGTPCMTNIWIPDGFKDIPVDRMAPRQRLKEALDRIFEEEIPLEYNMDAIESKVFGIGAESYTVGSHEFYMAYAMKNDKVLTLDAGHFHPTEMISDKISALLPYADDLLLHVSRPVRWDSDHVVILDDELLAIAQQIIRNDGIERIHIGLDFFDASINRIAAWVIGVRSMQKALLRALLEPTATLKELELNSDYTSRLALLEEQKSYPWGAVWDYYCYKSNAPVGKKWLDDVKKYEEEVLSKR